MTVVVVSDSIGNFDYVRVFATPLLTICRAITANDTARTHAIFLTL